MQNYWRGDYVSNVDPTYYIDDDVIVRGTADRDLMRICGNFQTVYAGAGNDMATVTGCNNTLVYGEAGNDFMGVNKFSRNASIIGGKGNDTLRTLATKTYMDGGDDADLFIPLNSTANTTMIGGAGNDTFWFIESATVTATGGTGADIYRFDHYYLYGPYSNAVVITDISSEDIIRYDYDASSGEELSITESNGNIILKDEDYGNFTITLKGGASKKSEIANVAYRSVNWSGTLGELFPEFFSDTDTNSGGDDTVTTDGGNTDTITNYNDYSLIYGGSKANTITVYGNNVTVYGEGGGDRIINYGKNVYIDGGAGNDTIVPVESLASNLTIDASDGDDWIQDNANTKNNFFYGGKGNDTINSHSENTYVDSGAGNDYISSAANYNTIIGGLGKDTIILARPNANVDSGDDYDIIKNLYFFRDYATSASIKAAKVMTALICSALTIQ